MHSIVEACCMDRSVPKSLILLAIWICVATFDVFAAQISTTTEDPVGRDILTIQTADRQFRLVIEEIDKTAGLPEFDDEEEELTLRATMLSGEGESEKSKWQTKLPGSIGDYDDDQLLVSQDGTFFIALPGAHADSHISQFSIYTSNSVKRVLLALHDERESYRREWITEYERIGNKDVLRFWDEEKDRWLAFTLPDGNKFDATPQLAAAWEQFTRRKILDAVYQRKRERLRERAQAMVPRFQRLTSFLTRSESTLELADVHYQFLLRRKNPEDRKIFEAMLEKHEDRERIEFWSRWRSITDRYDFDKRDREREMADAILAEWDGKEAKGWSKTLDPKPHLLGRLDGIIKLAAPVLTNAGLVYIHLVPDSKRNGKWTNEVTAEHLVCSLVDPLPEQSDLTDQINFSFRTISPGKYYLKAVWDKRHPDGNVIRAGPGDYESALVGPVVLKPGDCVTNFILICTNQIKGGEAYYAADAAAKRAWKIGDLSPANFPSADEKGDYLSRPAREWFIAKNQSPSTNAPRIVRLAVGPTTSMSWHGSRIEERTHSALKIYISDETKEVVPKLGRFEIIDEHGCRFRTGNSHDWIFEPGWRRSAVFVNYPRAAKTFHLVAWNSETNTPTKIWDCTVTNLAPTNAVTLQAERLPISKDLGPVTLTVSGIKIGNNDFRVEHKLHLKDGSDAGGWKLLNRELTDSRGSKIAGHGICREETLVFRCEAARNSKAAPHRWDLQLQELPSAEKFIATDVETNLFGARIRFLGVAGTGRTVFRLPISRSDRSPGMIDGDFEVELESNRVKLKSKSRIAVVEAPVDFVDTVVYVRGVGRLENQNNLEIDAATRLYFIPLNSLEKNGRVDLSFRADRRIPVEFAIAPSTNIKIQREY
jgi:hypothetical protein